MARKTNKTAHVLNLLSGSGGQKSASEENTPQSPPVEPIPEKPQEKITPAVSNIQMDSTEQEDDVSDLIHQQLLSSFLEEQNDLPPVDSEITSAVSDIAESFPEPESFAVEETLVPEEEPEPEPEMKPVLEPDSPLAKKPEPIPEPEPEPEPEKPQNTEPDFVVLNLVEEIVKDKIIYFMRQFEVCLCDRCIADTVALTLNGLRPKYIVTSPAAVAPLLSYYTNKYISDITVEATKACMTIKANPRHKTDESQ